MAGLDDRHAGFIRLSRFGFAAKLPKGRYSLQAFSNYTLELSSQVNAMRGQRLGKPVSFVIR